MSQRDSVSVEEVGCHCQGYLLCFSPGSIVPLHHVTKARFVSSDLTHTSTTITREIVSQLLEEGEQVLAEQGDAQTALSCFLKAAELEPANAAVHNNLGVVYWQLQDADKALEHLKQAAYLDPNEVSCILNCGEALAVSEKFGQAESLYKRFLKTHPDREDVKQALGAMEVKREEVLAREREAIRREAEVKLEREAIQREAEAKRLHCEPPAYEAGSAFRSNLQHWQQLQDEGYFESHLYYGNGSADLPIFGDDLEVIQKFVTLHRKMTMVIIGCGYGREAVLFAPHVKKIYGIDVNATILDKAEEFVERHGVTNFVPVLAEHWQEQINEKIDLVYEIVVFQHLTKDLTRDYFKGLSEKLSDSGVFLCQFVEAEQGADDAQLRKYEPCVNWTMKDIRTLAAQNNLEVLKTGNREFPEAHAIWHWVYFGKA